MDVLCIAVPLVIYILGLIPSYIALAESHPTETRIEHWSFIAFLFFWPLTAPLVFMAWLGRDIDEDRDQDNT